jgi:hypothetical protein
VGEQGGGGGGRGNLDGLIAGSPGPYAEPKLCTSNVHYSSADVVTLSEVLSNACQQLHTKTAVTMPRKKKSTSDAIQNLSMLGAKHLVTGI